MDLFGSRRRTGRRELARMRDQVFDLLGLADTVGVSVSEISCEDPDCPPHETVILISRADAPTVQAKVAKALVDVDADDLHAALAPILEGDLSA